MNIVIIISSLLRFFTYTHIYIYIYLISWFSQVIFMVRDWQDKCFNLIWLELCYMRRAERFTQTGLTLLISFSPSSRPTLIAINEDPDTMANSISLHQFSHQGSRSCPQLIGAPKTCLEVWGFSQAISHPSVIDTDNRIVRGEVRWGEELSEMRSSPACMPKVKGLTAAARNIALPYPPPLPHPPRLKQT